MTNDLSSDKTEANTKSPSIREDNITHNGKHITADSRIELVSFVLCPYVQRAVIILDEKEIPHIRTYIDLSNKPEWFKKISPLGKVPLLQTEQGVLFESAVIGEYLDEITTGTLHPADPFEKARHRSWIEFGSTILAAIAGLYSAPDHETFQQKHHVIVTKFEQLEAQLGETSYFAADNFQFIDAVYGPIFRYFDTLELFISDNFFQNTPRVKKYRTKLSKRTSVIQAVTEDYQSRLISFLLKKDSYLSQLISQKQLEALSIST
ncbi:glutathione S-transferase family protein [Kiloniella sp. EL199]|uniref:glutathione S-transferase family protein n=1 Tax=Kiloniella sp. EL199 TaxID=2107581 RepID=UPI000EA025C1|nr:glutathione S-transferase family protein [Kiloniella sp. EL199]